MTTPKIDDYLVRAKDISGGTMQEQLDAMLQQAAKDISDRPDATGTRKVTLVIDLTPKDTHVELAFQLGIACPKQPKGAGIGFLERGRLVTTTGLENIMKPTQLPWAVDNKE
jgi:hypothetical protein